MDGPFPFPEGHDILQLHLLLHSRFSSLPTSEGQGTILSSVFEYVNVHILGREEKRFERRINEAIYAKAEWYSFTHEVGMTSSIRQVQFSPRSLPRLLTTYLDSWLWPTWWPSGSVTGNWLLSPVEFCQTLRFLKCGLIKPRKTFQLCVSPSQIELGPEPSG